MRATLLLPRAIILGIRNVGRGSQKRLLAVCAQAAFLNPLRHISAMRRSRLASSLDPVYSLRYGITAVRSKMKLRKPYLFNLIWLTFWVSLITRDTTENESINTQNRRKFESRFLSRSDVSMAHHISRSFPVIGHVHGCLSAINQCNRLSTWLAWFGCERLITCYNYGARHCIAQISHTFRHSDRLTARVGCLATEKEGKIRQCMGVRKDMHGMKCSGFYIITVRTE